jgi:hypothetical protein
MNIRIEMEMLVIYQNTDITLIYKNRGVNAIVCNTFYFRLASHDCYQVKEKRGQRCRVIFPITN